MWGHFGAVGVNRISMGSNCLKATMRRDASAKRGKAGIAPGQREATQSSDAARKPPRRKPKSLPPKDSAAASGAIKPKLGRPRVEDVKKTLKALKPWAALGMSRSTWYARQAEKRTTEQTKR